jgi:hypothetical protein
MRRFEEMKMTRPTEPRICPPGCPHLDSGADPWGCDDCKLFEDVIMEQTVATENAYDKKAQEEWNEN